MQRSGRPGLGGAETALREEPRSVQTRRHHRRLPTRKRAPSGSRASRGEGGGAVRTAEPEARPARTSGSAAGRPARGGCRARAQSAGWPGATSGARAVAMAAGSRRARGRVLRWRAGRTRSPGTGPPRPQRHSHVAGHRGPGFGDGERGGGLLAPSRSRVRRRGRGPGRAHAAAAGHSCPDCYRTRAAPRPPPTCGRRGLAALARLPDPGRRLQEALLDAAPSPGRPGVCGARDRGPRVTELAE